MELLKWTRKFKGKKYHCSEKVTLFWVIFVVISSHLYLLGRSYVHCELILSQFMHLLCKLNHVGACHILTSFPMLSLLNC